MTVVPEREPEPVWEPLKSSQPRNREPVEPEPELLKSSQSGTGHNVILMSEKKRNHKKVGTTHAKKGGTGSGKGKRRVVPNEQERAELRTACLELMDLGMKLDGKRGEIITQELLGKRAKLSKTKAAWWLNNRSRTELKEAIS